MLMVVEEIKRNLVLLYCVLDVFSYVGILTSINDIHASYVTTYKPRASRYFAGKNM